MTIENYENLILDWADKRKLNFPENDKNQLLKSMSELGELADALLKRDIKQIKDGIGDVLVTLIIFSSSVGTEYLKIKIKSIINSLQKFRVLSSHRKVHRTPKRLRAFLLLRKNG